MRRGSSHTPETRARIAAAQRGKPRSAETRARIAAKKAAWARKNADLEARR